MDDHVRRLAEQLLQSGYAEMDDRERELLRRIASRTAVSRDLGASWTREATLGQRVADRVAAFGGSWTFIALFSAIIGAWVLLNAVMLARASAPDPYPFVFLNLILSMLAAFQAPVIMMSQNRQSEKDRQAAAHDYEVNLKAELEIMSLHDKVDDIRFHHLQENFDRLWKRIDGLAAARDEGGPRPSAG